MTVKEREVYKGEEKQKQLAGQRHAGRTIEYRSDGFRLYDEMDIDFGLL